MGPVARCRSVGVGRTSRPVRRVQIGSRSMSVLPGYSRYRSGKLRDYRNGTAPFQHPSRGCWARPGHGACGPSARATRATTPRSGPRICHDCGGAGRGPRHRSPPAWRRGRLGIGRRHIAVRHPYQALVAGHAQAGPALRWLVAARRHTDGLVTAPGRAQRAAPELAGMLAAHPGPGNRLSGGRPPIQRVAVQPLEVTL